MRKVLSTLKSAPAPEATAGGLFLGIEVDPTQIRAAVFDAAGRMMGRTKRSTKLERPDAEVLRRVAQCVQDAVDECDLRLDQIAGAGLGLAADVAEKWGSHVTVEPPVLPKRPYQKDLETLLGFPVFVEPDYQVATLGIYNAELAEKPSVLVALFGGVSLGGGILIKGSFPADNTLKPLLSILQTSRQELRAALPHPVIAEWSKAELRKAARHRDPRALEHGMVVARHAGLAAARILDLYRPDLLVLGGGLVDELKTQMLPVIQDTARAAVSSAANFTAHFQPSELGDNAVLLGGAVCAQRNLVA